MFYEDKCTLCGDCLTKCHYLAYDEEKAKREFKNLIDGKPSTVTGECLTCCACNMICPEGANPFDLIGKRQEETDTFISPRSKAMMGGAPMMPSSVVKGDSDKPVINLCTVGTLPGVIEGQLFDGMTKLAGGEYWCYIGWLHAGKPSEVEKNAQKFVDNVAKEVPEGNMLICYHDDCFMMLDHYVKEFGITVPFKYIHFFEYLRDYVKENTDKVKKLNMKVAYQQPCASRVSSHFKKKDEMLDELFGLIGVERVKRKFDRENALCCTSVIAAVEGMPQEEKDRYWKENLEDAKNAEAEAIAFLCPMCTMYLRSKAKKMEMEPYFISNLVRLALGEELTHGGAGKVY